MQTLVLVAHPYLANSTTQQFFKGAAEELSNIDYHIIPETIDVAAEQARLKSADRIIFQFPLYWYSAPALLKNWQDQVLTSAFVKGTAQLKDKTLGIVVTTGDAKADFQAGGQEHFTMSELLKPFEALANKAQMQYLPPLAVHQFLYLTPDDQSRLLVQYQQYLNNPNFQNFDGRVNWFLNRLADGTLHDVIAAQQEELNDLQWNLSQIKQSEDD